ncbi:MAG: S8 family serine peptidase [Acidobacteriota bacterium]
MRVRNLLTAIATLAALHAATAARNLCAGQAEIHPLLTRLEPDRRVAAYVVLEGEPLSGAMSAEALHVRPGRGGRTIAAITAEQEVLAPGLEAIGAVTTGRFVRLVNAVRVEVKAARLAEIATMPGVARIDPVGVYRPVNASSVPFLGAPAAWQRGPGLGDGTGVTIGVVDSGIDYTHADFGGPGTPSAYSGNDRTVIEPGTFPTTKVVGGWDFAGDEYDASASDQGARTPAPDPDPLDCGGHGTHVAGTAAGFGVLRSGATFAGPWSAATDFTQFAVGPGVAPGAELVAFKVFGCAGSTALLLDALERAADPNQDGDFTDALDVVNLSLGCDYSCGSPTEWDAVRRLSDGSLGRGTVVVAAAGNAGNTFFTSGDPANSPWAVSVAASIDDGLSSRALRVTQPASISALYPAVEGAITRPLSASGPVGGTVVRTDPAGACTALANGTEVAGRIALIDRGECLFSIKILNAQAAGARAVVVVNNQDGEAIVMGGDGAGISIPGVMVRRTDGNVFKAALGAGLAVGLDATLTVPRPDLADQIADLSSRGPAAWTAHLKPDLAAPGYGIASAAYGSGSEAAEASGTSMATPHVAGVAALVRQVRREWSPAQVKAALMNTAANARDGAQARYSPSRSGAGRVRADRATQASLLVATSTPGEVALSFGAVEADDHVRVERTVEIANHGFSPRLLTVSAIPIANRDGVTVSVTPDTVELGAGAIASVSVVLETDSAALTVYDDPTTPATQGGQPRHRLPEATGELRIAEAGIEVARLPYHAVVQHRSRTNAAAPQLCVPAGSGSFTLSVPLCGGSAHPQPVTSAFEMGWASSGQGFTDPALAAADVVAVGAASDVAQRGDLAQATLYFAVAAAGPWSTPQPALLRFEVSIDTDGDDASDWVLTTQNYGTVASGDPEDTGSSTDTFITALRRASASALAFEAYLNAFPANLLDTAPFGSRVLVLPVKASSIGLTSATTTIGYRVRGYSGGAAVSSSPRITFQPARPALDPSGGLDGRPYFPLHAPISLRIDRDSAAAPLQVLLLHHTNAPAGQVETVRLPVGVPGVDLSLGTELPAQAVRGLPFTSVFTVRNVGAAPASGVTFYDALSPGAPMTAESSQGTCEFESGSVRCMLGDLAPASMATVRVTISAERPRTYAQSARIAGAECESAPSDNLAGGTTSVSTGRPVRKRLNR